MFWFMNCTCPSANKKLPLPPVTGTGVDGEGNLRTGGIIVPAKSKVVGCRGQLVVDVALFQVRQKDRPHGIPAAVAAALGGGLGGRNRGGVVVNGRSRRE